MDPMEEDDPELYWSVVNWIMVDEDSTELCFGPMARDGDIQELSSGSVDSPDNLLRILLADEEEEQEDDVAGDGVLLLNALREEIAGAAAPTTTSSTTYYY